MPGAENKTEAQNAGQTGKERLDRFLFFARAVKSRSLAQKVIESGAVRVNSARTLRTDLKVGAGDVLTLALHGKVLVWRILDCGTRRGPAPEARALYEDLSPSPVRPEEQGADPVYALRPSGSGRPTKKHRRQIDQLRNG